MLSVSNNPFHDLDSESSLSDEFLMKGKSMKEVSIELFWNERDPLRGLGKEFLALSC